MEIRRVSPEAAGWSVEPEVAADEELSVDRELQVPAGFEYPNHFSSQDRWAEDPVNYSRTDVLRREVDSEPETTIDEVAELISVSRRIAELDDEIEERKTERGKLVERGIKIAKKSNGNRGVGFEDLSTNVNIAPSYSRRVEDIPRFREELGVLFGIIGHEVLKGKMDIPPGLKTKDGELVTSELVLEQIRNVLSGFGIGEDDQNKLLQNLNADVSITLSKWKKVAVEINEGRLSPKTVSAIETWSVKSVERKKGPNLEDDAN